MPDVYFISDLHFGHNNLHKLRRLGNYDNSEELWEHQVICINATVRSKSDVLWLLGDIFFSNQAFIKYAPRLNGNIKLVRGNHDRFNMSCLKYRGMEIYGAHSQYGFWLTHIPIHPQELHGRWNIHGHIHDSSKNLGYNYYNVNVDSIGYHPISLEYLKHQIITMDYIYSNEL